MTRPKIDTPRFIYVLDPMCSWCWAFSAAVDTLKQHYAFPWSLLMGGLAPDSDEPMDKAMQQKLQAIWQHIEQQTGTPFNYDFWSNNVPRRSTYLSCRAVISAETLAPERGFDMVRLIQKAYYHDAKNPSDLDTLVQLAQQMGLDTSLFTSLINSPDTQSKLEAQISEAHRLGAQGFPSLFIETESGLHALSYGYTDVEKLTQRVEAALQRKE